MSESLLKTIVIIGTALWLLSLTIGVATFFGWLEASDWGAFGDGFGMVNSIAAIGAAIGAVWTLNLQREELSKAREERLAAQHTQDIIAFETSFYQTLSLLRELRSEIHRTVLEGDDGKKITYSEKGFVVIDGIAKRIESHLPHPEHLDVRNCVQYMRNTYQEVLRRPYDDQIGPYLRLICRTLMSIDTDARLSEKEKVHYSRLLRSNLSSPEISIVAVAASNFENFGKLVEKYALLKYLEGEKIAFIAPYALGYQALGRETPRGA